SRPHVLVGPGAVGSAGQARVAPPLARRAAAGSRADRPAQAAAIPAAAVAVVVAAPAAAAVDAAAAADGNQINRCLTGELTCSLPLVQPVCFSVALPFSVSDAHRTSPGSSTPPNRPWILW